ncbi:MAG: ABC transporter permease [Gemmataceae bacterium]
MRLHIIRALVDKEFARHLANRGGIALALLLVAAAVLLSVFAPEETAGNAGGTGMVGGVHHCFLEFDRPTPLIKHLQANVPKELAEQIKFRETGNADDVNGLVIYPVGTGAIKLRQILEAGKPTVLQVDVWHPEGDRNALAPYEAWFWRESRRAFRAQAETKADAKKLGAEPSFDTGTDWTIIEAHEEFAKRVAGAGGSVPKLEINRKGLGGKVLDFRAAIATGMVVFALYFACVYLLPTLNCEERERGVLLAQALSPASPLEILAAKFLFYPVAGMLLAAILAGIYRPAVLGSLFFWLSLMAMAGGFLGIGMTVASLARTQRAAFLGAMCYLMSVSMVLLICSTNGIPVIPYLAVEYHGPRILHAALSGDVYPYHWLHLIGAIALACAWIFAAAWIFRRRGWQ